MDLTFSRKETNTAIALLIGWHSTAMLPLQGKYLYAYAQLKFLSWDSFYIFIMRFCCKMYRVTYQHFIRYMLAKGARLDLHSENGQGPRPIHWASRNGHVAVVDILLSVST